jgi:hypothetical protein
VKQLLRGRGIKTLQSDLQASIGDGDKKKESKEGRTGVVNPMMLEVLEAQLVAPSPVFGSRMLAGC